MKLLLKNNRGITLVALVITIIILIILSSVTIVFLAGEDGIISRAIETRFKSNLSQVEDKVITYYADKESENILLRQNYSGIQKLPVSTVYTDIQGTLLAEIEEVSEKEASEIEFYSINKELLPIDLPHDYIIDTTTLRVYDVQGEYFRGKMHHSLHGLGLGEYVQLTKPIVDEGSITWNDEHSIGWYAPNMNGFDENHTYLVYYNDGYTGKREIPVKQYMQEGKPNRREDGTYTLDDYEAKAWANAKVNANQLETWWVWIPRYAYKVDSTNQSMDIVFVTTENQPIREGDGVINDFDTYTVHSAFTETWEENGTTKTKELQGIWMSKFEPVQQSVSGAIAMTGKCYPPDMDGFDENYTYIELFDLEQNEFTEEKLLKTVDQNTVNNEGKWYDYPNKVWANVKTYANGQECWWVWIPRFAYKINESDQEMHVVFIDLTNRPMDRDVWGSAKVTEMGFTVHPAFTESDGKQLKGIWMSKFEANTQSITDTDAEAITDVCLAPDLDNFDENNTYIELFDLEQNRFTEEKLLKTVDRNTVNNDGKWYDYSKKVWANIKTNANGQECWWVWIPRFAYRPNDTDKEMNVIFIDLNDKPMDTEIWGEELPEDFIVHPAFNEQKQSVENGEVVTTPVIDTNNNPIKLNGIWMSKYEPTEQ